MINWTVGKRKLGEKSSVAAGENHFYFLPPLPSSDRPGVPWATLILAPLEAATETKKQQQPPRYLIFLAQTF